MANTTNFGWETPDDTDLVKDGAAAIRTLAGAIDTSLVDLKGGTTDQVLAKNSGTDMDFKWVADASGIPATIFDAKGDLIVASAADTAARLASSASNGDLLTVDTSTATGLKWAAPAGGGKVLQVVQGTLTSNATTTSGSFVDTGLTISITPSSASSKIMIVAMVRAGSGHTGTQSANLVVFNMVRDSTQLQAATFGIDKYSANAGNVYGTVNFSYLDSPATTSSTTYKVQYFAATANTTATIEANATSISSIVAMEIGA